MAPKHQIVRDHIEQLILSGDIRPGDALPGEMELSRHLDVSRNTIRHALDQLARTYRIERTRGRGTIFHGEVTASVDRMSVGFINSSITYTIYPGMLHGMEEGLFGGGYSLVLANGNYDPQKELEAVRRMLAQGVRGIIAEPMISGQLTAESDFVRLLNGAGVPVLTTNCVVPDLSASYVTMDDRWIGQCAAARLVAAGHRRIGCIYKADPDAGHARMEGFRDGLAEAGVPVVDDLIVPYSQEHEDLLPGAYFTRELMDRSDPPTAIFYFNDQIAVQAYDFCHEAHLSIPDDLSLIAVDNIGEAARVRPGLTTFDHPKELMGRIAADMMLAMLRSSTGTGGYGVSLRPPLVERGSVGRVLP